MGLFKRLVEAAERIATALTMGNDELARGQEHLDDKLRELRRELDAHVAAKRHTNTPRRKVQA